MKSSVIISALIVTSLAFTACNTAPKAQICKYKDGKKAAVSLVFKGESTFFVNPIAAELERYGWLPATFIVNPDNLRDATFNASQLSRSNCTKMASNGHEIAYNGKDPEGAVTDKVDKDWLDKTIRSGGWGITYAKEMEEYPLDFLETISLSQDKVWVGTYTQVRSYIKERENTTIDTSKDGDRITITPKCSLDPSEYKEKLDVRLGKRIVEIDPFGGPQTFDLSDPLVGKKIVFFGDSYVRNHQRPYTETWHYKVAQKHNMRYVNFGKNGNCVGFDRTDSGFGEPMTFKQKYLPKDADYIIIVAGHNDAGYITASDEAHQQFIDHMDELLTTLKKNYPQGKIGWVTPWDVQMPGFEQIIADIIEICGRHGIPVLDAAHTSGILVNDPEFRSKYFQGFFDNAHLNARGHDLLVDWGDAFITSL